jgi:hypothetical protein
MHAKFEDVERDQASIAAMIHSCSHIGMLQTSLVELVASLLTTLCVLATHCSTPGATHMASGEFERLCGLGNPTCCWVQTIPHATRCTMPL